MELSTTVAVVNCKRKGAVASRHTIASLISFSLSALAWWIDSMAFPFQAVAKKTPLLFHNRTFYSTQRL